MKLNATNKSTLKSIAIVFAIIMCSLDALRTSYLPAQSKSKRPMKNRSSISSPRKSVSVNITPTVEAVFVVAKNWLSHNRVIR